MKTIVRNETNVSLYFFDNAEVVDIQADKTVIGNPPRLIIQDCNASNVTLFEGVTDPSDWTGWKYLYTSADGWTLNPDWTPPEA
jgi:hypothetical protein